MYGFHITSVVAAGMLSVGWLAGAAQAQPAGACCCADHTCLILGPEECESIRRGDLNCDGEVDFGDINPFIMRLTNPAQYAALYPECPLANCDINGDGEVNFADINPFTALLVEGGGATCAWLGPETTCDMCWAPRGACCIHAGVCLADMTAAECEALEGQWQGADTGCDPNPCLPPVGACCAADDTCDSTTEAVCAAQGGAWLGAGVACTPNPCATQCAVWNSRDVDGPRPVAGHALAYDAARGVSVLVGGLEWLETWEWDGSAWARRYPNGSPSARSQHAMVYDAARGVVLLFGGVGAEQLFGDTWTWNGAQWTQLYPDPGPAPRAGHAMAYDAARGVAVLFGGVAGEYGLLGDTWEWDGSTWTLRSTEGPAPRIGHALAYDALRGVVVLFGGADDQVRVYSGETWEWDGGTWTLRSTTGPTPRAGHALAYDVGRGASVLFGGQNDDLGFDAETWLWDGAAWVQQTPLAPPPPRFLHAMTYDALRAETVLFGGAAAYYFGDTWTFSLVPAPQITHSPADLTACVGASVQFSVVAEGSGALAYQWYLDGVALEDEPPYFGATAPTLTIDPVGPEVAGSFTVIVTDDCGATASPAAVLDVRPLTEITGQPAGLTRCTGESAVFSVSAAGSNLSYRWRQNGVDLQDGAHISGATTPTLSIAPVGLTDRGQYDVVVTGDCGIETSVMATLHVPATTQITVQPHSQTLTEGLYATFEVVAAGAELTYRWLKDGQPLIDSARINGATSSVLTLGPTTPADAGSYAVRVTGTCGTELSAAATLAVLPDADRDGVPDSEDNCPNVPNPNQEDVDNDGVGDACDGCPTDPHKIEPGVCGCGVPDTDSDGDGTPDCLDECPDDPDKTAPGVCGCGVADTDIDGDGSPDCLDECPFDPDKIEPGVCGCGATEVDSDGDGIPDCVDGCPDDPHKHDPGVCGCGHSDLDTDNDGVPDCIDNCPFVANRDQTDSNSNGIGDACEDDQSERPRPANSSFIRGLIDLITGQRDTADADYSAGVLGKVVDAIQTLDVDGDGTADGDTSGADGEPGDSARGNVGVALCPASSALLLGLTLAGLCRSGTWLRRGAAASRRGKGH